MAAKDNMDPSLEPVSDLERVVNRWILDYYIFLAVDNFKNEQYRDFCEIRDVLQPLLVRPLEANAVIPKKIRLIQFLTRINDGDKLDYIFESQESLTPLESALSVLENITEEMTVTQKDLERVQTSIREMLVIVCIKNKEFDKAKEMLMKYFPKGMVGKKAMFLGLIAQKSSEHPALEKVTYHQFKQEMLHFCQGLFSYTQPFLCRAARSLLVKRQEAQLHVNGKDCCSSLQKPLEEHLLSGPAGRQETCRLEPSAPPSGVQLTRSQLKAAYTSLAENLGEPMTFNQLEEEVEREVKQENARGVATVDPEGSVLLLTGSPRQGSDAVSEQDVPGSQRDSDSPIEASPADLVPAADLAPEAEPQNPPDRAQTSAAPQWRSKGWPCTIARLVVEPDSQESTDLPEIGLLADMEEGPVADMEEVPVAADEEEVPVEEVPVAVDVEEVPMAMDVEDGPVVKRVKSGSRDNPLSSTSTQIPPTRKYRKRRASKMNPQTPSEGEDDVCIIDDQSERPAGHGRNAQFTSTPQKSSTPQRSSSNRRGSSHTERVNRQDSSTPQQGSAHRSSPPKPPKASTSKKGADSKWKNLFNLATGARDQWSDEEDLFEAPQKEGSGNTTVSIPGTRRMWTAEESDWVKEGVKRYGEGNWGKIKSSFPFDGRTSVNIKDRWRTMKKLKMV
ncbi:hypothetical protein DPEC_G00193940 [Dallia pectoralis]|uniref:Uncharacterized protein n=1 Tax=Dallia pectoralis TaxID=75939 RepID=A0ACC2G7F6_DALPE|nr:hypothetical protein DPEC_G00193940 [Dallia pectoralis]